eukprot:5258152-Prymnesium_polylepis.2
MSAGCGGAAVGRCGIREGAPRARARPCATMNATSSHEPHRRVLVALLGLFRHHEAGFRALEQHLIAPTEQSSSTVTNIALYTDPLSVCSPKEQHEGRCCVRLPNDVAAAAHHTYGGRLLRVHIAEHSSHSERLADAWLHSLRELVMEHDATLVLRPDARLTKPLDVWKGEQLRSQLERAAALCTRFISLHSALPDMRPCCGLCYSQHAAEIASPRPATSGARRCSRRRSNGPATLLARLERQRPCVLARAEMVLPCSPTL